MEQPYQYTQRQISIQGNSFLSLTLGFGTRALGTR